MILSGTLTASKIYENLKQDISKLNLKPTLGAILVGDSAASLRYIKQKRKFAEKIGMGFHLTQLPEDISQDDLLYAISAYNKNENISGFIVQLPLPVHIDASAVINSISPDKDVDGFHPQNQGKVLIGDTSGLSPCTPNGVMKIFQEYDIQLSGKNIVVLGQSNIVGKPMAQMCINAGATVSSCNHLTDDITVFTKTADILISATGVVGLVTPDIVQDNCVIIDVGFTIVDGEIKGDTKTQEFIDGGYKITPVPGGVGPMTVAMLMNNTFLAHKRAYEK